MTWTSLKHLYPRNLYVKAGVCLFDMGKPSVLVKMKTDDCTVPWPASAWVMWLTLFPNTCNICGWPWHSYITVVSHICLSRADTLTLNPLHLLFPLVETVLSCSARMDSRPFVQCSTPDTQRCFINPGDSRADTDVQPLWWMSHGGGTGHTVALFCRVRMMIDSGGFLRSNKVSSFYTKRSSVLTHSFGG